MKRIAKLISALLIVCVAWTPMSLQAMMIGTDNAVASVEQLHNRDKVVEFMQRENVAKQIEGFGISSAAAQDRVNSMTPEEINQLAANIDSLPAGADTSMAFTATTWLVAAIILLIAFIVWSKYYKKA